MSKTATWLGSLVVLGVVAWLSKVGTAPSASEPEWREVAPGVWRSPGWPAGYALVTGTHALLIDAPVVPTGLAAQGIKTVDRVLLTHHHRDSCAAAGVLRAQKIPVLAPKAATPWLTRDGVKKYWHESLPLRNSRTAYLVLPEGLEGVDCSLEDKQCINWEGWEIEVIATPGHSPDQLSFFARKGKEGERYLFCGDTLAEQGKMWSPYSTDWDHWTNAGTKPAAASLRKLATLPIAKLFPAHGEVINSNPRETLTRTADVVEELSFLKSYERYTKERLKNPPRYAFLAREQAESNGSKPWTQVSKHLWLTGNTYVLVSRDNAFLVVDPWDPHSAKQLPKLKADQRLGEMEVVLCSHAHFDHYDGIYSILQQQKPAFWTLDQVAPPLADPLRWRAPFLDPRPIKIDRQFKEGETATWREYTFKFHHLPGQTYYTMGVETVIDGKRCYFTADNFFHQDQFSGTGGWMGLNRSWPLAYAASAQKVLDAAPEWVLAEHGGPFEFNAEDFKRRVQWGKVNARAADALSPSGHHERDWNPHRVHVEPILQKAKPGATLKATLVVTNPLARAETLTVRLQGRGLTTDQVWNFEVEGGRSVRREITLSLAKEIPPGRHILILNATEKEKPEASDSFLALDVTR